jgi:hypothetical protein
MKVASTAIERISFMGHTFGMARVDKGYAPLKAMCQAIGVDFASQYKRLKKAHWGGIVKMTMPDQRGVPQEVVMIPRRAISMWIATIHVSQVAFAARETIKVFQDEFVDLAEAWFFGESTLSPEMTEAVTKIRAELAETRRQAGLAISIGNIAKGMAAEAGERIDAILSPYSPSRVEPMTARQARDEWRILGSDGRLLPDRCLPYVSKALAAICRATRQPFSRVEEGNKEVNAYPVGVIAAFKADHDLRSRVTRETYARLTQPRLFA